MNRILQFTLVVLLMFSSSLSAQYESRGGKYDKVDADNFFSVGNYYDAIPLYELLITQYPNKLDYQLKAGVCYLHLSSNPEKAIELIKGVYDNKPTTQNALYYLARAYAVNYKFDLAIEHYEKAQTSMVTSSNKKYKIPLLIQQSRNGIDLLEDSIEVEIKNLGGLINTSANEYSPSISVDESMLIFTYRGLKSVGGRQDKYYKAAVNGSYYEDIYKSEFIKDSWTQSMPLSDSINTKLNEGTILLTDGGAKLYMFKDTKMASGDIFVSDKENGEWSEPKGLSINSKYWEGHVAVNLKGNFMIFSSNRPGGFGGKDLYSAKLQEDGTWGEIKNLGKTINTKYNEDAPFFHPDGVVFNFSSEGHTSMGGYDIFEANMIGDSAFSEPENLGYPINTTSNDIFYCTSGKGNVFYSSARKGGFGQNDIYQIVNNGMTIKGIVTTNKETAVPISNMLVSILNKAKTFSLTDTTDGKGRYNFSNLPNDDYYLMVMDEGDDIGIFDSIFVFKGQVTKMGKAQSEVKINDIETDEDGLFNVEVKRKTKELFEMSAKELKDKYGAQTADHLIFVVQVAALQNPKYFDGKDIASFGEVDKVVLEDGLTRFTIGKFKTLNEANIVLAQLKALGREDAFVLMLFNGKRTYLQDLVDSGTFK